MLGGRRPKSTLVAALVSAVDITLLGISINAATGNPVDFPYPGWLQLIQRRPWLSVAVFTSVAAGVALWQWWFASTGETPIVSIGDVHHHYPSSEPTMPADLPWNIPTPVRAFMGRDPQLDALHATFTRQRAAELRPAAALHGTPGIGKTQLARAYAHLHREEYELGWWIPAETTVTITGALADLAVRLGAPADLPQTELATRARELLGRRDGWLLVFDSAAEPSMLESYWPPSGHGDVLVTSRNPAWRGVADPILVDLLPLPSATRFLLDRTGASDEAAAEALAKQLGRLPLALEQAAAYIEQSHLTIAQYRTEFRRRRNKLLGKGTPVAYDGTVDATFALAVDRLAKKSLAAVQLLRMSAFLAPDQLPLDLLLSVPDLLPKLLGDAVRDPLVRTETIGLLYRASLFTPDVDGTARVHELVQAVALAYLTDRDRLALLQQTVTLLLYLFPRQPNQPDSWHVSARLFPHAQALLRHAAHLVDPAVGFLATLLGVYVWARGLGLALARELDEQALAVWKSLYPGDHPATASSLTNLSLDLLELGEVERAQELVEQALVMWQSLNVGDHTDFALALNNLASAHRLLGEAGRARQLDEKALAMRLRLYPGDHPDIALSRANLALDLRLMGEVEQPRKLDEQALAMCQRLYTDDHPNTARSLSNLAADLRELGELGRARELDDQALAMRQRLYADDHSDTVESLTALAADLREFGEVARARELHEQALAMSQRLYAGDHSDIADCLMNRGVDLREAGEVERACELHEQGLAMFQRLYSGDHPKIAFGAEYLANTLDLLGEVKRAGDLHEQALAMRQRLYAGDHPNTAASLVNLGNHLRKAGEIERARDLHEQALAMLQRLYPGDHPNIARSLSSLAQDLRKLGDARRAQELNEEARAMWQRLLPDGHPNMADNLRKPGKIKRALYLLKHASFK